jgi:non-heme chloroperoxidase
MNKYNATLSGTDTWVSRPDGTQIYTRKAGQGHQVVVFAHGYGFDMSEWNLVWEDLLKEDFTLVAFDQMGHGKTTIGKSGLSSDAMIEDYKTVLEHYKVRNAVLVAHSMGSFLGMKLMIRYPEIVKERLKSCLLISAFAGDANKQNFQNRFQIPLIQSGILFKLFKIKAIAHAFVKTVIGENPKKEMIEAFLKVFTAQNHKVLIPILLAFVNESYYAQLSQIQIPCGILIGTRDSTTPPFHTQDLKKNIPQSYIVHLPNKGHCLNWEAPEAIINEIKKLAKM